MDIGEDIEVLLRNKQYAVLQETVFDPASQPIIKLFGMDLITRICENGIAFCEEMENLVLCQDMLMHVVKSIRPKEALISLLEQAEIFAHCESNKFSSLLAPLQHVMLNLPKKREHSFSWVLSILNSHLKFRHQFPDEFKMKVSSGNDALLLEEDARIKDTLLTYKEYCNFYDPFVRQFWIERNVAYASNNSEAITSIHRQQDILRDNLVQMLGDPLLHFDLHLDKRKQKGKEEPESGDACSSDSPPVIIASDARLICERLMGFLRAVDQHPEYYYEWSTRKLFLEQTNLKSKPVFSEDDSDDNDSDECIVDFGSVVNYYYLIHVEHMNDDMLPSVLSPSYTFISTSRLMLNILQDNKAGHMSLLKCFSLSKTVLDKIDHMTPGIRLNAELLETSYIAQFIESVAYHTVFCPTLEVRKVGLQVLKELMWKFEPKGRYDFILFVLNRVEHDGIKGYIISQMKDCIRVTLDTSNDELKTFFTGNALLKLLRLTCTLRNAITTDLIDNKEQIMCALNLVLYLVIRDKELNITGFAAALPDIENNLLNPLFKALELSRAHYQLKLKQLDDPATVEEQLKERQKLTESVDIVINDAASAAEDIRITLQEQKRGLNDALMAFNIMNATLARVTELCETFKKSMKKPDPSPNVVVS